MITLQATLIIMILLFATIGWSRGWAREVVAAAGLILALFAINQVGFQVLGFIGGAPDPNLQIEAYPVEQLAAINRTQIFVMSAFLLVIAGFSYQGPTLASAVAGRLRVRDNIQERILGFIVGGVNGYLIVGSIQSFNEFVLFANNWQRLPAGREYVLAPTITRPLNLAFDYLVYLPPQLLAPFLLPLLIIVFLFVIIVLI